jgi:hypothetical protein
MIPERLFRDGEFARHAYARTNMKGTMRRVLSILLLSIFGFASFGSLVQSSHVSRLPICCRRAGAHHCASMGEMPEDAAARIAAANAGSEATIGAPSHCPLYPGTLHATLTSAFVAASQHVVPAEMQTAERIYTFSASHSDSSCFGAHAVRGPPAVVLA